MVTSILGVFRLCRNSESWWKLMLDNVSEEQMVSINVSLSRMLARQLYCNAHYSTMFTSTTLREDYIFGFASNLILFIFELLVLKYSVLPRK